MNKYSIGQKLEIHSIPVTDGGTSLNGKVVTVMDLPGRYEHLPDCYVIALPDGRLTPAIDKYLRPYPPALPNGRGDVDKKSSWPEFQKATTLSWEVVDRIRGAETGV